MSVHVTTIDEIVDEIDENFDKTAPLKSLRQAKADLEDDALEARSLADALLAYVSEAEARISEIDELILDRESPGGDSIALAATG
jgi:hypothetical protein